MFEWYNRWQYEISFFIAGWCALATINSLIAGDYLWAAINAFLVWVNIKIAKS